jgi:hypothetical protein
MTFATLAASVLMVFLQTSKSSIDGFVLSTTTNKPIPGAQVTAMKIPDPPAGTTTGVVGGVLRTGPGVPPERSAVTTDANGRFIFRDIDPGRYVVSASADGYARQQVGPPPEGQPGMSTTVSVAIGQTSNNVVLHLMLAGTVSGRVTGANGEPLVGMEVQLIRPMYQVDGRRNLQPFGSAQTNDRGEYRLFWMPPGRYYLSVNPSSRPIPGGVVSSTPGNNKYPRSFYPGTSDITGAAEIEITPGGELNGIDLRLASQPAYRIRGRVVDSATGQFPQSASINLVQRDLPFTGAPGFGQYNAGDGTFEIRDVLSGSYWIRAQLPTARQLQPGPTGRIAPPPTAIAAVEISGSDVDGILLSIQPPFSISGRVRVEGQLSASAPPGSRVALQSAAPGILFLAPPTPAIVGGDGRFQFDNVAPGEYQVAVLGLGGPNSQSLYVKEARLGSIDVLGQTIAITGPVSEGLDILVATNAMQLTGSVTNDRQQPVMRAQVVLVPDRRERRDLYKIGITDASGQFTIRSIPPGSYTAFAVDAADSGSIFDPVVMKKIESKGQRVTVSESSNTGLNLKVIPSIGR